MIGVALRGVGARKLRTALTTLAILLGVSMIAGTYVLTDQIKGGFAALQSTLYSRTDVEISPKPAFTSGMTAPKPMDARLVDRVKQVDGVAATAGDLDVPGALVVDGKLRKSSGGGGTIVVTTLPPAFRAHDYMKGRAPERSGEIALLSDTASKNGVGVGSHIGLGTSTGTQAVTVVGTFDIGGNTSIGGTDLVEAQLSDVQRWFDRPGQLTSIFVKADPGISPRQLVERLQPIVPRGVRVRTGQQAAAENASDISDAINGFLGPALLAFGGAALLVGAFIIFNTFSITVAERTREFALLRTLGATRRQILGSVAVEAVVIGLLASALGMLAGLGFAKTIASLFESVGLGVPTSGLALAPRTIAVSLFVGVGITLVAAFAPARRATRVPPIAALEGRAPVTTQRRRRLAPVAAAVVALAGLAVLTAGLFSSAAASNRLATMGLGVILLFVGVALSARWFVRPLASAVGWPLERLFSEPGLLARENAMRSPARTATTAAALMVGLGLVVFVAVFADGLKTSITGSVDKLISADVIVRGQSNFVPLPEATSRAVRSARGVGIAADVYVDQVQVNGHPSSANTDVIGGIEPGQFPLVYRARWIAGTPADIFSRLRVGTALIEEQFAKTHHIAVGQRFSILTPSGARANLLAIGEYRDPQVMQGVMISVDQFRAVSSNRDPWVIMARRANGTSADAARDSVTAALAPFPTAKAQSQAQYKDSINAQLNQFVYLLYALLAMSVVISLFGIANSLFLSIHERTREFGLLRAVGATRRQVREIVRLESVITAVIGGLLGTVVGVAFAWLVTQALGDLGLGFSVPVAQLVGFLILAVLVGIAAAAIPARRGARVSVMTALQTE